MARRLNRDEFKSLGLTLLMLRRSRGIQLQRLADAARVSKANLSRYERGNAVPHSVTLARLLRTLGVSLEAFFQAQHFVQQAITAGARPPGREAQ